MAMDADIIVVGAGPAGLAFCRTLSASNLKILLIEKNSQESIANPKFDAREIALTHASRSSMKKLGIWGRVKPEHIYPLYDAKVFNGTSDYTLHFEDKKSLDTGEGLGFFISNNHIRKASYEAVLEQDNVEMRFGVGVADVKVNYEGAVVTLEDGTKLTSRLLVAADSRFSSTRRKMGIGADSNDYGRTVVTFRIKHTISNNHTAMECFHYGRTLAILPLDEHLSSCVFTIDSNRAHEILDMSSSEREADVYKLLDGKLGEITVDSEMVSYPLVGVHAKRFIGPSCAVIGDAAVGMHPVTAHGYNLGLASAVILGSEIIKAERRGQDFASQAVLSAYEQKHMLKTRFLYHGTNAVVGIFTNDSEPVKVLRSAILRISNNLPPFKKFVTNMLTKSE
ncbi:5-demethoxyubiquinol-8 5-hydroxylase UbiM [Taylorella equigenitalis]|uniref:2-octaprenyl-3-methyl-6-methoxy-1,4-benzoquinol hydroxylase n=4 Tax=Taylorella equigenitalis TaxID=29575 RepID=A0A654KIE2_TAYEM|nr:5-demethoxyubiquinol-8 5-hydroxylase UbiM [Taylorella equigenitalis]ADU92175.1 2-octaprenyl-3-methyl-6-methoxy-1,4-benzoquinol hydroxylase [Taylorella equigenitalis MCE9]AFN35734.1 UbiH family protein [Taylorella equigenitalis ATCC 35865]ASY30378.1 ubiquinone biosynthesis protein UbiH [Taylorella equigenitalis]ASY39152.1 ubiquinone biosynthesis protein UbiH [Taylorella equigenitalis]ASY40670.1 ubiquinone biosynthesis protein UbiH [Taylorella equigenitalis]